MDAKAPVLRPRGSGKMESTMNFSFTQHGKHHCHLRLGWMCRLPAAVLLAAGYVPGCSKSGAGGEPAEPLRERPAVVTVAVALEKTVPLELTTFGTVEAYFTVSVKSLVGGELTVVHVKEGQEVRKGELLFTIDPRPFQDAVEQAESHLQRDEAQLKNALIEVTRYEDMLKKGFATAEQVDQFRANADVLRAALRADKADIDTAKLNLEYCSIRSPVDGLVGSFLIDLGNIIKANDLPIVVLRQIAPIHISFTLPERELPRVKKYMAAQKLEVAAAAAGGVPKPDELGLGTPDEGPPETGVVVFLDSAVDETTGTIRLKGQFENTAHRLWPGQFVNVTLTLGRRDGAVVIPSQAIQTGQQGTYVFVVKADNTVEMRPVELGPVVRGETVIEKGVRAGETVVTDGQLRLVPGSAVEGKKGVPKPDELGLGTPREGARAETGP